MFLSQYAAIYDTWESLKLKISWLKKYESISMQGSHSSSRIKPMIDTRTNTISSELETHDVAHQLASHLSKVLVVRNFGTYDPFDDKHLSWDDAYQFWTDFASQLQLQLQLQVPSNESLDGLPNQFSFTHSFTDENANQSESESENEDENEDENTKEIDSYVEDYSTTRSPSVPFSGFQLPHRYYNFEHEREKKARVRSKSHGNTPSTRNQEKPLPNVYKNRWNKSWPW